MEDYINTQLHKTTLHNLILGEQFDSNEISKSEIFAHELYDISPNLLNEILILIYNEDISDAKTLIGLLTIISSFKYKELIPTVTCIALTSFGHKSQEVKEYAIRAFDIWMAPETIKILETYKSNIPWLERYKQSIITKLFNLGGI